MQRWCFYTTVFGKTNKFQSEFNRRTAIDGLQTLLKKFPEKIPISFVDEIMAKTSVLAVPLQTVNALSQSLMTQQGDQKNLLRLFGITVGSTIKVQIYYWPLLSS